MAVGMAVLYYCTSAERERGKGSWRINVASELFCPGKLRMQMSRTRFLRKSQGRSRQWLAVVCGATVLFVFGCDVQRRKSDAELGLNPQQTAGRRLYDQYCDRCHEPYSSRDKKGRSLQGVFKKQFLSQSGMPANDERVGDMILTGRNMMPAFSQVMSKQQVADLLAYLHTL
jgi:mono/diheme cytochrome c family protein